MTPPNSIRSQTNVTFEAVFPNANVTNFEWLLKKESQDVLTTSANPISYMFNGAHEGPGSYVAQARFQKSDGNICILEKSFQILKDDDMCAKPTGISGQTIGYTGEEVSFSVNSEPCMD